MMEKIPCPGCRTELDFEVTTCPICMRPRSKYEITRAYSNLRAEQARARKRPFIIAGWLLAAAAAGGAGYRWRAPIGAAAASARARFARFADEAMDPKRLSNRDLDVPPPPDAPGPAAPVAPPPPPSGQTAAAPQAPAAPPKPAGAVMAVRPEPVGDLPLTALDPAYQWALRGRVYDLLTLKPVPMASFTVKTTNGGMAGGFVSDPDGRYLTVLPRLQQGGYEIVGAGGGIHAVVFYESDIPYAQLSAAERREMADNAASGESHPSPLSDVIGETALHRDIFVVPQR